MIRRPPSILVQLAAVILVSAFAAQAIVLALLLLVPAPQPRRMTLSEALAAFSASPAELEAVSLGRRQIDEPPPTGSGQALLIARSIAGGLGRPVSDVRVSMMEGPEISRPAAPSLGTVRILDRREAAALGLGGSVGPPQFDLAAMLRTLPLPVAPFRAAVRQPGGRWTEIRPLEPFFAGWRGRILLALGLSALLTLPLAWWSARAITRPIRLLGQAAERIGIESPAEPLAEEGPREVRSAAILINAMQERLRGYLHERTSMIGAIAHDLRTPLTGLRLTAEQAAPAVRDRMVADIKRMDVMITQALAFVRGEIVREQREPVDLMELAAGCAREAEERGGAVTVGPAVSLSIVGELLNLSRAIDNLIDNAVVYGGGAEILGSVEGGNAVLRVLDRGPGLPPSDTERLFEPFERGDPSRNRATGGVGLGLTSARGIVRAHGGDITLHNRPGGGLEARLTLPLA